MEFGTIEQVNSFYANEVVVGGDSVSFERISPSKTSGVFKFINWLAQTRLGRSFGLRGRVKVKVLNTESVKVIKVPVQQLEQLTPKAFKAARNARIAFDLMGQAIDKPEIETLTDRITDAFDAGRIEQFAADRLARLFIRKITDARQEAISHVIQNTTDRVVTEAMRQTFGDKFNTGIDTVIREFSTHLNRVLPPLPAVPSIASTSTDNRSTDHAQRDRSQVDSSISELAQQILQLATQKRGQAAKDSYAKFRDEILPQLQQLRPAEGNEALIRALETFAQVQHDRGAYSAAKRVREQLDQVLKAAAG